MNSETKQCQNCKTSFQIDAQDFDFYKKISVPPPTWCPECRMIRRMTWRNIRNLYKRPCAAPGHTESLVSVYSPDKSLRVYDQTHWWSDACDPMANGKAYDFSAPFFVQFAQLLRETPLPNVSNMNPVGSEYVNVTIDSKNCYLIFSSTENENCSYSEGINGCRDSSDLLNSRKSERLYWCIDCRECFNMAFSVKAIGCADSFYLYDCRNCTNCFGCWNLRNKQYCIFNEQYDKEGYFEKLRSFDLGSYARSAEAKRLHAGKFSGAVRRFADIVHSENSTGDNIEFSRNCRDSFDIAGAADSRYVWRLLESGGSDNYDITVATKPTLSYEGCGVGKGYASKFGIASGESTDSSYTSSCISGCSHLFACIGLRNKQYCILNKQYTKEEYEALVPKIIEHMNTMPYVDKQGRVYKYGEFFPPELSPFAYNETIAQEYFPLTKEEALAKGYRWRDPDTKQYTVTKTPEDLPDHIKDITDDILKETIGCASNSDALRGRSPDPVASGCTTAFKLIPDELQFYRRMNLPLPRLCPNCRHYERLKQRNPLKLWHRQCMCAGTHGAKSTEQRAYQNSATHSHGENPCLNQFETSYAPERPEIVYCESCYNAEVA